MLAGVRGRLPYFLSVFVLILVAFVSECLFSTQDCFEFLNSFHSYPADEFFKVYTLLGDGLISIGAVLIFALLRKYRESITVFAAYLLSGVFTQLLKHIFAAPRPARFYREMSLEYSHFVEGVTLHNTNSFPSGHTASAFAMATVFALIYRKPIVGLLMLLLAALVGYSRIYLGQHFLADVVAGAVIGVVSSLISYHWVQQLKIDFNKKMFSRSSKRVDDISSGINSKSTFDG